MDHLLMPLGAVTQMIGLADLQGFIAISRRRFHSTVEEREMPIISVERY
jgi:hypothetical protein